jgi:hypothetical protein
VKQVIDLAPCLPSQGEAPCPPAALLTCPAAHAHRREPLRGELVQPASRATEDEARQPCRTGRQLPPAQ